MQRTLIRVLRLLPLRLAYGLMAFAIPFYVLFDGRGRKASYRFFHRHIGYGPLKALWHVFVNMYNMGKVVLDRFAAYGGHRFRIVDEGHEHWAREMDADTPVLLLSSHLGNFELCGYMMPQPRPLKIVVYADEAQTVMENRMRMFAANRIQMIPVRKDMSHIFEINAELASGGMVSMPADRCWGSAKVFRIPFLGEEASFPAGSFTLAQRRNAACYVIFVMKEGVNLYRGLVEKLPEAASAEELARAYAGCLERVAGAYPDQWYNFYDFWNVRT